MGLVFRRCRCALALAVAALAHWACGASSPLFEGTADDGVATGAVSHGARGGAGIIGGTTGTGSSGLGGSGGRPMGTGASKTGGTGGTVVRPSGGTGGLVPAQPVCPQSSLRGAPQPRLVGNTLGLADTYTPTCGASPGSGDASFAWDVPYSGRFRFDTVGSSFDTVLAIEKGVCSGDEVACNDDRQNSSESEATLDLVGGQSVTVVVDGYSGAEGAFVLNITEARTCPDLALASSAVPSTFGDELGAYVDRYTSACGAVAGSPDFVATFTAESSGVYVFDTQESDFDTVLGVFEGACGTTELACSDDYMVSTSRVSMGMLAGEQVTVVVDGYAGDQGHFRLSVDAMAPGSCCDEHPEAGGCTPVDVAACVCAAMPYCCVDGWDQACVDAVEPLGCGNCGRCPDDAVDNKPPISISGSTVGAADRRTAECGASPRSGDYVLEYTAPYRSTYVFDTRGSDFDTVLSLNQGGCLQPTSACNDDDDYGHGTSTLVATMDQGETVALVVDGFQGAQGQFVLNVRDQKMSGDCCYETPTIPGCTEESVAQCVCRTTPACCDNAWTRSCVDAVEADGCGTCQPRILDPDGSAP
jgi:hypothetical protein